MRLGSGSSTAGHEDSQARHLVLDAETLPFSILSQPFSDYHLGSAQEAPILYLNFFSLAYFYTLDSLKILSC